MNLTPEDLQRQFLAEIEKPLCDQEDRNVLASILSGQAELEEKQARAKVLSDQLRADRHPSVEEGFERRRDQLRRAIDRWGRLNNVKLADPAERRDLARQEEELAADRRETRNRIAECRAELIAIPACIGDLDGVQQHLLRHMMMRNRARIAFFRKNRTFLHRRLDAVRQRYIRRYRDEIDQCRRAVDEYAAHAVGVRNFTTHRQLPFANFTAKKDLACLLNPPGAFPLCLALDEGTSRRLCLPNVVFSKKREELPFPDDQILVMFPRDDRVNIKCTSCNSVIDKEYCAKLRSGRSVCWWCAYDMGLRRQCQRCCWTEDNQGEVPTLFCSLDDKGPRCEGDCDYSRLVAE